MGFTVEGITEEHYAQLDVFEQKLWQHVIRGNKLGRSDVESILTTLAKERLDRMRVNRELAGYIHKFREEHRCPSCKGLGYHGTLDNHIDCGECPDNSGLTQLPPTYGESR